MRTQGAAAARQRLLSYFVVEAPRGAGAEALVSRNPPVDRIGVMTDLRNIMSAEEARFKAQFLKWVYVADILFGVTQDGGGVVFIPGRGSRSDRPLGPVHRDGPRIARSARRARVARRA